MKTSVLSACALVCLAIGCGGGDKTGTTSEALTVRGSVPRSTLITDNAKAIAVSASGHVYTAYLDRQGDFTLNLPAGHAYRVLIANTLPNGHHSVVGRLTLANRTTGTSAWLGARATGNVDLGNLHLGSASGSNQIQCSCSSGGSSGGDGSSGYGGSGGDDDDKSDKSGGGDSYGSGDHHGDDYGCHQDDGEKGNICSGGGETDLHAQHDPGSYCDDSGLDDDDDKNEDDGPSCSGKGGGYGGEGSDKGSGSGDSYGSGSDSSGADGSGNAGSSGGYSGSDSSGSSNAGSSCGCQAEGNPCHCNSDCQNGQVCVAGYCSK